MTGPAVPRIGYRYFRGVWFAYVDESFDDEKHWVIALLVEHTRVNETSKALREIVQSAADDYNVPDKAELHGYDVFHGEADWTATHPMPRARVAVYTAVFQALVDAEAWIIMRGVHKPRLRARYVSPDHPHRVTMTHLIERIDSFCKGDTGGDDHAVLVADEHHETQSALLRDLVIYQEHGTWGYLAKKISRVVDTIHFVNSKTNPLVQGADMVGFMVRRAKDHTETDARNQAAVDDLMQMIESRVYHHHCWHP